MSGIINLRGEENNEESKGKLGSSIRKLVQKSRSYFVFQKKKALKDVASSQLKIFTTFGLVLLFLMILVAGTQKLYQMYRFTKNSAKEVEVSLVPHVLSSLKDKDFITLSLNFSRLESIAHDLEQNLPDESSNVQVGVSTSKTIKNTLDALQKYLQAVNGATDVLDNLKQFGLDYQHMSKDELHAKYKNMSQFISYQWVYLQKNAFVPFDEASKIFDSIDTTGLPSSFSMKIQKAKEYIAYLKQAKIEMEFLMPRLLSLIGDGYPRTYVVLLQNSSEMRATGGFIGSLAFVKFNNGWITDVSFKDVYEFDGQFFQDVPPPPGIEQISSQFRLRDANYWADFPTSAKQIMWFLDKEKGPGVDGVFAITDTVVKDILTVVGPISLKDPEVVIRDKNFSQIMSLLVESKKNNKNPKIYLFDFAQILIEKVKENIFLPEMRKVVFRSIEGKNVLAYSSHQDLQELFEYFAIDGEVLLPQSTNMTEDYLMLAHTSVGANKSDQYVKERLEHTTKIISKSVIRDNLIIEREHTWSKQDEEELIAVAKKLGLKTIDSKLLYILGQGINKSYIRAYVPNTATIVQVDGINASDISTYQEFGRKVFAFTMNVLPGEKKRVSLSYEMTDVQGKDTSNGTYIPYHFVLEKQPGMPTLTIIKKVALDGKWIVVANESSDSIHSLDASLLNPDSTVNVENRRDFPFLFFTPQ